MNRTPMKKRKTKRLSEFDREFEAMRPLVKARSHGRCEAKTSDCTGNAYPIHHMRGRGFPGDNDESRLLHCCSSCHRYIHAHATESYDKGWMIHRGVFQ